MMETILVILLIILVLNPPLAILLIPAFLILIGYLLTDGQWLFTWEWWIEDENYLLVILSGGASIVAMLFCNWLAGERR